MDNVEHKWTLRGQRAGYLDNLAPTRGLSGSESPEAATDCPCTTDAIRRWRVDRASDCPCIPGRSVHAPSIPSAEDSPRDAQAFWDGEYTPMPQPPAAAANDTSPEGRL